MTVWARVFNAANTGSALADADVTVDDRVFALVDAEVSDPLGSSAEHQITLPREHPSASAFSVPGRVVRVGHVDGGEVEDQKFTVRDVSDQVVGGRQVVVVKGPDLREQLDGAVIRGWQEPPLNPRSSVRPYNFASPNLDEGPWTDELFQQDRSGAAWPTVPRWTDPYSSQPVWSAFSYSNTVGSIFVRRWFTLSTDMTIALNCAADDGFSAWVNGVRVIERIPRPGTQEFAWDSPYGEEIPLTAGTHLFAMEAINRGGQGALWVSCWDAASGDGDPPIFIHGPSDMSSNPWIGDWKVLAYPAQRPAPPIGQCLVDAFADAQADGELAGWTLGCTATHDSASNAFPILEHAPARSSSVLDLVESLEREGRIETRVRKGAGKVLDVYAPTYTPTPSGTTVLLAEVTELRRGVKRG